MGRTGAPPWGGRWVLTANMSGRRVCPPAETKRKKVGKERERNREALANAGKRHGNVDHGSA
ncbi:hypothetical protein ES702_02937 [subsurface metagenome]